MDIVIQNPWWVNKNAIENDEKVKEALNKKSKVTYSLDRQDNLIILGPRQVGKSTMLKLCIYDLIANKNIDPKNVFYFSCEPLKDKKELIDVMAAFLEFSGETAGKKYLFLDEATLVKEWEYSIKYFLETMRKDEQILVSGSSAMLLKKGIERMPGRKIETELFLPLSFREFLLHFASNELKQELKNNSIAYASFDLKKMHSLSMKLQPFLSELNSKLSTYLKTGGFLKAVYEFLEKGSISESTYEAYTKWILSDLSKLDKREIIFKSIVKGIVKSYCSKFSLRSMAKEMEIPSHVTVSEYLELLQTILLTNNLYQVALHKKLPALRKERKCYFLDPFLYSVFKGYSIGKYADYSTGNEDKLIEGVVCESLARFNRINLDTTHYLWYFYSAEETDFAMKVGEDVVGIELKWQKKTDKRDFKNFRSFRHKLLLTKKDFGFEQDLLMIPASIFLALAKHRQERV